MVDIHLVIRGYRKRDRSNWERTRWLIWSISAMLGGEGTGTPQDLCTFPWEKERGKEEEDKEALERLLQEAREHNARIL